MNLVKGLEEVLPPSEGSSPPSTCGGEGQDHLLILYLLRCETGLDDLGRMKVFLSGLGVVKGFQGVQGWVLVGVPPGLLHDAADVDVKGLWLVVPRVEAGSNIRWSVISGSGQEVQCLSSHCSVS